MAIALVVGLGLAVGCRALAQPVLRAMMVDGPVPAASPPLPPSPRTASTASTPPPPPLPPPPPQVLAAATEYTVIRALGFPAALLTMVLQVHAAARSPRPRRSPHRHQPCPHAPTPAHPVFSCVLPLQAAFLATKDAFSPLIAVPLAAVTNLVLDLFLVGTLGLGTAGAAWGTTASLYVNGVTLLLMWRAKAATLGERTPLFATPTRAEMRRLLVFVGASI